MATNTAAVQARELPWQALHFLRKSINYNDTGLSSGVPFSAYLPAGASIMYTMVKIKTAFNGTAAAIVVGTNSTSFNNIVGASDVDETVTEAQMVLTGADLTISSDTLPYIKYTDSGSATTGVAEITIVYTPNNDA